MLMLYGSDAGLVAASEVWSQETPLIEDDAEFEDRFGAAVGLADHNGDGRADLDVGVLSEDGSGPTEIDSGLAHVLFGTSTGITASGAQIWYVGAPGLLGERERDAYLGWALG